jgi:hypothetical protein
MKTMLMYDKLTPINREQHHNWRIQPSSKHLSFARETNSAMLAVTELPVAVLDYPCVFVAAGDQHTLVAVLGMRDKENLFIDAEGRWDTNSYLPAFVRRYPFMLAEEPGSTQLTVCIDSAFDGINQSTGEALFDAEGKDTPYMQTMQKFMLDFHNDMQRTAAFAKRLVELDLLVERNIEFQIGTEQFNLRGFKVIDESKLRQLSPTVAQELFASGALGWIYAHLLSLNNVSKLGARLSGRLAN